MAADRNDPPREGAGPAAGHPYDLEWDDEPGVFEVYGQAAEDAAVARAEEDIQAGRVVSHDKVVEWLKTWGTPHSKPYPREWFE